MVNLLKSAFPGAPITVSLDRLIASVQSSREKTKSVEVKSDPPPIFVSSQPAILLIVPGQPALGSVKGLKLQFVVNSNWDLFFVPEESRYYLLADKIWLTSDSLNGSWSSAGKLPAELAKLPAGEGWEHVQKAVATHTANSQPVKEAPRMSICSRIRSKEIATCNEARVRNVQETKADRKEKERVAGIN